MKEETLKNCHVEKLVNEWKTPFAKSEFDRPPAVQCVWNALDNFHFLHSAPVFLHRSVHFKINHRAFARRDTEIYESTWIFNRSVSLRTKRRLYRDIEKK